MAAQLDPDLEKLVDDAILRGKAPAKVALRAMPAQTVVPRILSRIADGRPQVRAAALELAGCTAAFVQHVPVDAILEHVDDPDARVRLACMFALKRNGPGAKPWYAKDGAAIASVVKRLAASDPDKAVKEQAGHVVTLLKL